MTNTPKSADIALTNLTEQEAHTLHITISHLFYHVTDTVFKLGAALREMRDRKGYVALGYNTMEEYITELKIKRRTVYNYLKVDQCFTDRIQYLPGVDPKKLLETPYSNILEINHIILDKNELGEWKYNNETVKHWLERAHDLDNIELVKALKDFGGIRPDPLVIKSKPCVYFHHGTISKDGSWVVEFRQYRPQWNISLQNLYDSLKGKKLQLIIKEVEE